MQITLAKIIEALSFVVEPDLKKDIVALNLVSNNLQGSHGWAEKQ